LRDGAGCVVADFLVGEYRKEMPWEVTTFRIHQATVTASLVRVLNPKAARLEYRKAVNSALEPLVLATASRVASLRWRCEGKECRIQDNMEAARLDGWNTR